MFDITLLPYLEIEFRLGKIVNNNFNTNIGFNNFTKLKNIFDLCNTWIEKLDFEYTDVFYNEIRCVLDKKDCITKKTILKENIKNHSCDLRMCISQELPIVAKNSNENETFRRHKKRYRYSTSHWHIDLTKVVSNNITSYECEFEFNIHYARTHSIHFLKSYALKEINRILVCANI